MSINSLKFVEKISKCIYSHKTVNNTKIFDLLKKYNASDWKNYTYYQNNKYEQYSEAYLFNKTTKHKLKYFNNKMAYPELLKIDNNEIYKRELNIKIIRWDPFYSGCYHFHENNACYYKVLEGVLHETVNMEDTELTKVIEKNDIGFIHDRMGPHKIKNLIDDYSYSLHVYYK